jgi:hypothetical protein
MDQFKQRCEILRQHCDNQTPIVKASLINFPAYLRSYLMPSLSRWSVLNDAVREVHPANLSLRDLSEDDPVF